MRVLSYFFSHLSPRYVCTRPQDDEEIQLFVNFSFHYFVFSPPPFVRRTTSSFPSPLHQFQVKLTERGKAQTHTRIGEKVCVRECVILRKEKELYIRLCVC